MSGKQMKSWALFALAIGLLPNGCSSSSGGSGGEGGADGTDMPMLRVAHLAPEVPAAGATRLDFDIVDEGSLNGFGFGRVSDYAALPPGTHTITASRAGTSTQRLGRLTTRLETEGRYTVVAYRDSTEPSALGLLIIDESTVGLAADRSRLLIVHGAGDSAWSTVNVVDADTDDVYAADLMFANQAEPVELLAGAYRLGFDVAPPSPMIDEGPFAVNLLGDEALILLVVDTDTVEASVTAAVYVLGPDTIGSISPLPPE
jgi:hypothetical protein